MKITTLILLVLLNGIALGSECQEKASLVLILKSKDFLEAKGQAHLEEKFEGINPSTLNPYSVEKFCDSGNPDNDILLNFEYFKRSSFKNCSTENIVETIGSGDVDVHQRPVSIVIDFLKDSECSISIQRKSEDLYLSLIQKVYGHLSEKKTNYSKLCHVVREDLGKIYKINRNCR